MKKIVWGIIGIIVVVIAIVGLSTINPTGLFTASQNGPKEINVIGLLPISGLNASAGEAINQGIQLAIDEVNSKQNKYKLNYLLEDNQSDPTIAVNIVQKALTQEPTIIISGLTPTTVPILPILKDKNVILLIQSSIHPGLAPQGKYFFKDYADALDWANTLAGTVKNKGYTKTALISFQTEQGELFVNQVNKTITPILTEKYDTKLTDFRTIVLKIKESGADSIIFAGFPANVNLMLKALEETEIITPTYTINGDWPETTLNGIGNKVKPNTAGFEFSTTSKNEKGNAFLKKFIEKYGKEPKIDSAIAYDDIQILANAITDCGRDVFCIANKIRETKNYEGASGSISFDESGNSKRNSKLLQYVNGEWVEAK